MLRVKTIEKKQSKTVKDDIPKSLTNLVESIFEIAYTIKDDELKKVYTEKVNLQKKLKEDVEKFSTKKKKLNELTSELAKQKVINKILNLIQNLKAKGVLKGKSAETVGKLINELDKKDFQTLREIEEKLYALL